MGAVQSGVVTHEEFKNYIYGTTVLMLAPQLDPECSFADTTAIKDEDKHVLPLVSKSPNLTLEERIVEYTQYYGTNNGKEEAIDRYVRENILDSKEHVMAFVTRLVSQLQDRRQRRPAVSGGAALAPVHETTSVASPVSARAAVTLPPSLPAQVAVPQAYVPAQIDAQASSHRSFRPVEVRGQQKLHRKMAALDRAIDNEQLAAQLQASRVYPARPGPGPAWRQAYAHAHHGEEGIEEIYADDENGNGNGNGDADEVQQD